MLPATLPAHIKQIGGSNFEASLVIGLFSSLSLAARILSGNVIDAIGEKRLIATGALTIALSTIAFIWLPIPGILALRCVQGFGWGISTAAIATAVYKIVPESRRGEGSGYYALTVITSLSLTPLVGILLMEHFPFTVLLLVSASITMTALCLLGPGLANLPVTAPVKRPISIANLFERGALIPSLLCFINCVPLCGVMAYLVLFGQERHLSHLWVFFIGYTLMIMVTRPAIGRLFDRRGHRVIIVPGVIAMMLGLFVLSQTTGLTLLIAASLLYGLGYGAVHPSLQTWAVNRCPPHRKAAANGLFMSSIDLGYITGALILGLLAGSTGYAAMYLYSVSALVLFLAIYFYTTRQPEDLPHASPKA